jgi:protein-L-isoaspartate(D-aspartate) O-methyltransferase
MHARIPHLLVGLLAATPTGANPAAMNPEVETMIEGQIVARGLTHKPTLTAMRAVPRHRFVPDDVKKEAYADHPLPIGHGQTISQPFIVAFMTEAAEIKPGLKVLEIGTGSGYQAAILAAMGAKVFTIEIIPALAERAAATLKKMGYDQVQVRAGDGYAGWPAEAPFDAIIVTAAPDTIPPALLEQLAEGGRLVIPVGPRLGSQELLLVTKTKGKIQQRHLLPVRFVPFTREKAAQEKP